MSSVGTAPLQQMARSLTMLRASHGREPVARLERAFLQYARLRAPLRSAEAQQQPTWFFPGLKTLARPWPDPAQLPGVGLLEANAEQVIAELSAAMRAAGALQQYDDGTPHHGRWQALHLRYGAKSVERNRHLAPFTMALLESLPHIGEMGIVSILAPGAHIKPHCGLHNFRWTAHLGLEIPSPCGFRVGSETRVWQRARCLLFDDSFEHEAWNHAEQPRAVLLVDFWHPELTTLEIEVLNRFAADLASLRSRLEEGRDPAGTLQPP